MIIAVKTEPHTEYLRMNLLVAEMSTIPAYTIKTEGPLSLKIFILQKLNT